LQRKFWFVLSVLLALSASGCTNISSSGLSSSTPASQSKIVLTPESIDFSSVAVGQKNSQTIKISNEDTKLRKITAMHITGAGLSLTGLKFPLSLAPQTSQTFNVEFAPAATGTVNGKLTVEASAIRTETFSVKGTGTKTSAKLDLSPATVNFGNTSLKQTVAQRITVSNGGTAPISVTQVILGGAGFAVSELPARFELQAQQQRTFLVTFFPTVKGPAKGGVTFVTKEAGGLVTMTMAGTGVDGGAEPARSSHSVALGWQASAGNVEGYNVYRAEGSASGPIYTKLTASPLSTINYRDSDVASGEEYQYFVTSVSTSGRESAHSDGVTVTIPNP
jgi:Abnormal spindle-like microcephaly-assoc'd, ASPM-SPD-2-Hydin